MKRRIVTVGTSGGTAVLAAVLATVVHAQEQAAGSPAAGSPAAGSSVIEQPAPAFGRTIGDVLVQRVPIPADDDAAREALATGLAETLPAGRIGAWLERLPVRSGETGRGEAVLELRYQIVNVPPEPRTIRLPPVSFGDGVPEVAEWPIGVVPLTSRESVEAGGLPVLRPDRRLPAFDTGERRVRLIATGGVLLATAIAWLGWWWRRRRADRVRRPFERARRELRRLPATGRDEAPAAWTALHRALDDTAGGTVHRGSLERLLHAAPWLAPSREAIEAFYAASAARFFSHPARPEPYPVTALGHALYRAERRHAG